MFYSWCNNQIVVVDLLVEKLESLEMTEGRKSDIGEYSGNLRGMCGTESGAF
ncbi:MAG: hypothetical protein ACI4TA_07480 [Acetatifactor sp.]